MFAELTDVLRPWKVVNTNPFLFERHRYTKSSVVLSSDLVAANQTRDGLPLTSFQDEFGQRNATQLFA